MSILCLQLQRRAFTLQIFSLQLYTDHFGFTNTNEDAHMQSRADTGFHSGCCEILKGEKIFKKGKKGKFSIDRTKEKNCAYFRVKNLSF